jgi:hypothetical protein
MMATMPTSTFHPAFEKMLGRPLEDEDKIQIAALQDATSGALSRDDPMWGIFAYIYAHTPRDFAELERLRLTKDALESMEKKIDGFPQIAVDSIKGQIEETLKKSLLQDLATKLTADLKSPSADDIAEAVQSSLGSTNIPGPEAITRAVAKALADFKVAAAPRTTIKDWLGEHVATLAYAGLGLFGTFILAAGGAYWAGQQSAEQVFSAREAAIAADSTAIEAWTRTGTGRAVYQWAKVNEADITQVLRCRYPGAKIIQQGQGVATCYPAGGGNGYYIQIP